MNNDDLLKDFNRLNKIIDDLLYFNLIHESRLSDIENEISNIYDNENLEWNKEENSEYEEYLLDAPISELYDRAKDKKKFIADLRQSILDNIFR